MFDRNEKYKIVEREYKKQPITRDEKRNESIHAESTDYLNGLTDYQILQLQNELKATIGDKLTSRYTTDVQQVQPQQQQPQPLDQEIDLAKTKEIYATLTKTPQQPNYFDLPELTTTYTEDQLLTALSSKESTLIAHSLAYLRHVSITKWTVLTDRLLPLLVHKSKLVRLKAYDLLYYYDSLPVAIIDVLRKSRIDGELTQTLLKELQS